MRIRKLASVLFGTALCLEKARRHRAWRIWSLCAEGPKARKKKYFLRLVRQKAAGEVRVAFGSWLRLTRKVKELETKLVAREHFTVRVLRRVCASATLIAWKKWKEATVLCRLRHFMLERAARFMAQSGLRLKRREVTRKLGIWKAAVSEAQAQAQDLATKLHLFTRVLEYKVNLSLCNRFLVLRHNTEKMGLHFNTRKRLRSLQIKYVHRSLARSCVAKLRAGWKKWVSFVHNLTAEWCKLLEKELLDARISLENGSKRTKHMNDLVPLYVLMAQKRTKAMFHGMSRAFNVWQKVKTLHNHTPYLVLHTKVFFRILTPCACLVSAYFL